MEKKLRKTRRRFSEALVAVTARASLVEVVAMTKSSPPPLCGPAPIWMLDPSLIVFVSFAAT
jgi:hypothetical protein